jgi:undecaprenyl-diphosphatase
VSDLEWWQAAVMGLLQGLTEFLPVSSSAHLSLTPWVFGWPAPGLAFDVALHVGTLAAVAWYFRGEWFSLARASLRLAMRGGRPADEHEWRVVLIILGTIPAAIGGVLLNDYAEQVFRAPALTASALIVMGAVLWLADRYAPAQRPLGALRMGDALLIGLAQVAALVPGVSRSGATITAGRALGATRETAAVFSFLLALPITAAAAAVKVPEAIAESASLAPLIVGVIAAAVSGWIAIAVLLSMVRERGYGVFAWYRLALGIAILWLVASRA